MRWFAWRRPDRDQIARRWPALELGDEQAQLEALAELGRLQDARLEERDFVAAEPLLERLVVAGSAPVRRAALDAWATVLAGRVRRAHMDLLADLASEPDLDPEILDRAIRAALTFDDRGALAAELARNARRAR